MRVTDPEISDRAQVKPGWGIAIGILVIILGVIAIARPFFASIASALVFGWVFILAGIVQIVHAFQSRRDGHITWKLIIGILYLLAGILIVANPFQGVRRFPRMKVPYHLVLKQDKQINRQSELWCYQP